MQHQLHNRSLAVGLLSLHDVNYALPCDALLCVFAVLQQLLPAFVLHGCWQQLACCTRCHLHCIITWLPPSTSASSSIVGGSAVVEEVVCVLAV
jgi:hypothetical protein